MIDIFKTFEETIYLLLQADQLETDLGYWD